MAKQITDLVEAGTTAGQGLLEASLGRMELSLSQIRLRLVICTYRVK
jgi:hypothetical protein